MRNVEKDSVLFMRRAGKIAGLRRAWLPALVMGLSACTALQGHFEQPRVEVTSFRPVASNSSALNFEIGLRVVNPNRDALKLQGMSYTIALDGYQLITGVGKDLPVIDGYSEGTITLTAAASIFETMKFFGGLMNNPKDNVEYDFQTKLDIGNFMPAIRLQESGRISLRPTPTQ